MNADRYQQLFERIPSEFLNSVQSWPTRKFASMVRQEHGLSLVLSPDEDRVETLAWWEQPAVFRTFVPPARDFHWLPESLLAAVRSVFPQEVLIVLEGGVGSGASELLVVEVSTVIPESERREETPWQVVLGSLGLPGVPGLRLDPAGWCHQGVRRRRVDDGSQTCLHAALDGVRCALLEAYRDGGQDVGAIEERIYGALKSLARKGGYPEFEFEVDAQSTLVSPEDSSLVWSLRKVVLRTLALWHWAHGDAYSGPEDPDNMLWATAEDWYHEL